ncbi:hypothetical protein ABIB82_007178 [Bradyrhizobium sp. i1.8.4]
MSGIGGNSHISQLRNGSTDGGTAYEMGFAPGGCSRTSSSAPLGTRAESPDLVAPAVRIECDAVSRGVNVSGPGGEPGSSNQASHLRIALDPYPEDAALINEAAQAARVAIAAGHPWEQLETSRQVSQATYMVRKFSEWLRREHKNAMAGRPGDNTVDEDIATFARIHRRGSHLVGLRMLRTHAGALGPPDHAPCRRAQRVPYPQDTALVKAAAEAAKANIDAEKPWPFVGIRKRVNQAVRSLNRFSGWLKTTSRRAIDGRLNDVSLKEDITAFYMAKRKFSVDSGVRMLREHAKDLEAFAADLEQQLEVDEAPSAAGDGAHQYSSVQPLFTQLFGETLPSESPPASTGLQGGGSDPNVAISPMMRNDAFDAPMPNVTEQSSSARGVGGSHLSDDAQRDCAQQLLFTQLFGESPPPSESPQRSRGLRGGGSDFNGAMWPTTRDAMARQDFGHVLDLGWVHGPQPAPDILIGALNRRRILPTPRQPMTNFYLRGQPYTAQLGRGSREVSPNNPLGVNIILIPRLKGG